jgi:3-O-alpha-D-mannopyranosyl-alpha-D-mannopyranose xylosylphosphotransferase
MLLLAPLSSADFYSVPFGSVLRLDSGFGLKVRPDLDPSKFSDAGEWGGLQHANHLLSQRFPKRPRHYLHHLPKTLSMPIVHEAMHMYPNDIALAATRSFRELSIGSGDIELGFMATHLRIERWREALLWTWAVGKMGSLSTEDAGRWGDSAREELRSLLGMQTLTGEASIVKQERDTLRDVASAFEAGSWEAPKSTSYRFSSMDGHLPPLHRAGQLREDVCGIDVHQCFGESFINGTDDVSADEMFKRLTFDQWRCGDCCEFWTVTKSGIGRRTSN